MFTDKELIASNTREIANINWDDIDIERMIRINDYQTFITSDCRLAFKYVHQRLGHQIMNEVKKGKKNEAVSYLAIVERYTFDFDGEDNYLVRGIIREIIVVIRLLLIQNIKKLFHKTYGKNH